MHAMSTIISIYQYCLHRNSSTKAQSPRSQLLVLPLSHVYSFPLFSEFFIAIRTINNITRIIMSITIITALIYITLEKNI